MHADIWLVIALAIIQGLTEFFPVSSSGHLVLFEALFGMRGEDSGPSVLLEVAVHVGTLGAIALFYRSKLKTLLSAICALLRRGKDGYARYRDEIRYIGYIIVGTVPAAIVGLLLHDRIAGLFNIPILASLFLVATAAYLLLGLQRRAERRISWRSALVIGIAQALAILPGISRSGWTITTAMLLGLGFVEAAEFSFLLSIPAILGALALELAGGEMPLEAGMATPLIVGAFVAFLSGWLALKLLIGILTRGVFHRFAWYLFPAGIAAVLYFAFSSSR